MPDATGAGQAFGQRLGKLIEDEIHRAAQDALYGTDFVSVSRGTLADFRGRLCAHDGLAVDSGGRPYLVIESKMIEKAKHATEKAAKVAREHPDLKRAHPTLRAFIAVLGGDFTREPLRMVEASGAHVLFIPRDHIAAVCSERRINILWEDAQAGPAAVAALGQYDTLTRDDLRDLGRRLLEPVGGHLVQVIRSAIANAPANAVTWVWVDIFFERGEIPHHEFPSIPEALHYLSSWSH